MLAEGISSEENSLLMELKDSLSQLLGDSLVRFVLYGSKARGDYDSRSDIDVAVIVRGLTRELKIKIFDRVVEIEFKHTMSISALVLSEEDFLRLKKLERRIALDIEIEGIPI